MPSQLRQRRRPQPRPEPFLQDVLGCPLTLIPASIIGLHESTDLRVVITSPRAITAIDEDGGNWQVTTENGDFTCDPPNVTSGKYIVLSVVGDNSTPLFVQYIGGDDAVTAGGGVMDLSVPIAIDEAFA